MEKYKARLVAKGFSQKVGFDYLDTFIPVVIIILCLALYFNWTLRQVVVYNAFLNGNLQEEVYTSEPPCFEVTYSYGRPLVCKFTKYLYGVKLAPRAWFEKFKDCLLNNLKFLSS